MLCSELNRKILQLTPPHIVSSHAPSSYEELSRASRLVVWSGASDNTIYGDKRVNWAFRAWHDSLHLALNAPFTLQGETIVALEQARILGGKYAEIVLAEVVGQAEYFALQGEFPRNQVEFINSYLKGKI